MSPADSSDHDDRLKRKTAAQLDERTDVSGYEFRATEDAGVHVAVDEEDATRLYHVTLETHPDGSEATNWSLLGTVEDD